MGSWEGVNARTGAGRTEMDTASERQKPEQESDIEKRRWGDQVS